MRETSPHRKCFEFEVEPGLASTSAEHKSVAIAMPSELGGHFVYLLALLIIALCFSHSVYLFIYHQSRREQRH